MKTTELTGAALDWAVAKSEGWKDWEADDEAFTWAPDGCGWLSLESYKPSTDWSKAGPIIEREKLSVEWIDSERWLCGRNSGQTPLIAAMRCYVASKLGDDVDAPEELKNV